SAIGHHRRSPPALRTAYSSIASLLNILLLLPAVGVSTELAVGVGVALIISFGLTGTAAIAPFLNALKALATDRARFVFKLQSAGVGVADGDLLFDDSRFLPC